MPCFCSTGICQRAGMVAAVIAGTIFNAHGYELKDGAYQVFPSDDLQAALNAAATNNTVKLVLVHEGAYVPRSRRQALIYLNRRHDGIHLQGVGRPILSAANPEIADHASSAYPAVVNHVI